MVYTTDELAEKLQEMLRNKRFEDEVVEFKEAKSNFSFQDIGKYFSALSNEANLRSKREGWLVFGVSNDREIGGSNYRKEGNSLHGLKKEIAEGTNNDLTFIEIYELQVRGNRVILFQIPPAIQGIPTTWHGEAWARKDESLCPLPINKMDEIRAQIGYDWSKEIVKDASFDDLDPDAVAYARKLFLQRQDAAAKAVLENASDLEILNKAGLTFKNQITRTALLLLGKSESAFYFDGFRPRITWTLYNADNSQKAYEHFDIPLLLAVDKVYAKIRNEKYRYIAEELTLFPEEVNQYDPNLIKELINNCIAHSDYRLRGKINVEEFEDRLVFINEGAFIPGTIETALMPGYKPPYYRNAFLCNAMVNLYMIDTNAMGIPKIYQIQRDRCFPLPTYDLDNPNRVSVTVYGNILDQNYTKLLRLDGTLNIRTVFLLDQVQKKRPITKEDSKMLKKAGLIEGRYPNIYVSLKVAEAVGSKTEYIKNRGIKDEAIKQMVLNALQVRPLSKSELMDVVGAAVPNVLNAEQREKKLSNLFQKMKREGLIHFVGNKKEGKWHIGKES